MRFARTIERGNRQVLLRASASLDGNDYVVVVESHYQGEQFVSVSLGGFPTFDQACAAMDSLDEDDVVRCITGLIDDISEDG